MARTTLVYACLLATILVAGAMPTNAGNVKGLLDDVKSYPPACSNSDDEFGMGKTDVSCRYSCGKSTFLAIGAESADAQATVYGDTSCGGTNAICRSLGPQCKGVSEGTTEYGQLKASCYAASDEWFDSPLTVACASHSVDPQGIVCSLVKNLCEGSAAQTRGLEPPTANPRVDDLVRRCEAVVQGIGQVGGFVVAVIEGPQFFAVQYDASSGCRASAGLL